MPAADDSAPGAGEGPAARAATGLAAAVVALLAGPGLGPGAAAEVTLRGRFAPELRLFAQDPAFAGQLQRLQPSVALTGEWAFASADGRHELVVSPFLRLDGRDPERTHGDLREAFYRYAGDGLEVLAGIGRVFWGVTESRHLVDVINQVDAVEGIDEEDRLGRRWCGFRC